MRWYMFWQSATRKMKDLPFGRKMYMGKVYDETTAYDDETLGNRGIRICRVICWKSSKRNTI